MTPGQAKRHDSGEVTLPHPGSVICDDHPGRVGPACCFVSEGCQGIGPDREIYPLPAPLPRPKESILSHPGASFPCASAPICLPRRISGPGGDLRKPAGFTLHQGVRGPPGDVGRSRIVSSCPYLNPARKNRSWAILGPRFPAFPSICPPRRGSAGVRWVVHITERFMARTTPTGPARRPEPDAVSEGRRHLTVGTGQAAPATDVR